MLQLHSSTGRQRITYHCLNSVPWGNSTQQQNAIKLQGDDDLEFHNKMPQRLRPVVIEDNCQVSPRNRCPQVLSCLACGLSKLSILPIQACIKHDKQTLISECRARGG